MNIIGIYNAIGTISGEISYALKKLAGRGDCPLCELTHGWNPFGKQSWREACAKTSIDITLLHREEADKAQVQAAGQLPAFIVEQHGEWRIMMTNAEIKEWKDNPLGLLKALENKLASTCESPLP